MPPRLARNEDLVLFWVVNRPVRQQPKLGHQAQPIGIRGQQSEALVDAFKDAKLVVRILVLETFFLQLDKLLIRERFEKEGLPKRQAPIASDPLFQLFK
jgi:hypothetical protein